MSASRPGSARNRAEQPLVMSATPSAKVPTTPSQIEAISMETFAPSAAVDAVVRAVVQREDALMQSVHKAFRRAAVPSPTALYAKLPTPKPGTPELQRVFLCLNADDAEAIESAIVRCVAQTSKAFAKLMIIGHWMIAWELLERCSRLLDAVGESREVQRPHLASSKTTTAADGTVLVAGLVDPAGAFMLEQRASVRRLYATFERQRQRGLQSVDSAATECQRTLLPVDQRPGGRDAPITRLYSMDPAQRHRLFFDRERLMKTPNAAKVGEENSASAARAARPLSAKVDRPCLHQPAVPQRPMSARNRHVHAPHQKGHSSYRRPQLGLDKVTRPTSAATTRAVPVKPVRPMSAASTTRPSRPTSAHHPPPMATIPHRSHSSASSQTRYDAVLQEETQAFEAARADPRRVWRKPLLVERFEPVDPDTVVDEYELSIMGWMQATEGGGDADTNEEEATTGASSSPQLSAADRLLALQRWITTINPERTSHSNAVLARFLRRAAACFRVRALRRAALEAIDRRVQGECFPSSPPRAVPSTADEEVLLMAQYEKEIEYHTAAIAAKGLFFAFKRRIQPRPSWRSDEGTQIPEPDIEGAIKASRAVQGAAASWASSEGHFAQEENTLFPAMTGVENTPTTFLTSATVDDTTRIPQPPLQTRDAHVSMPVHKAQQVIAKSYRRHAERSHAVIRVGLDALEDFRRASGCSTCRVAVTCRDRPEEAKGGTYIVPPIFEMKRLSD